MKSSKARAAPGRARRRPPRRRFDPALAVLWLLILVPPLLVSPAARDSFRLPKELVSEVLALGSLLFLGLRWRPASAINVRAVLRSPAFVAVAPLVFVAALGLVVTEHPWHVRLGWQSLAVGALCLVGWSLALDARERWRLLGGTLIPATLLALLGVLQFHRLYTPFQVEQTGDDRLSLSSLAGGPFDLAAYLVLPALIAQAGWMRAVSRRARLGFALVLALLVYALMLTQTLTALAAFVAASAVLWIRQLYPRRLELRRLPWRRLGVAGVALALLAVSLGMGAAPLRERLGQKLEHLRSGDLDHLLTGRLDGWRAALWMAGQRPWMGVGQGAYTAEFAPTKLALLDSGVTFFAGHRDPHFSSAHNEFLELAAEGGLLGGLALLWGLGHLALALGRRSSVMLPSQGGAEDAPSAEALTLAGVTGLGVLALGYFPLHLAIVAYPHLLLLSGVLAPNDLRRKRTGESRLGRIPGRRLKVVLLSSLGLLVMTQALTAERHWRASQMLKAVEDDTIEASAMGILSLPMAGNHLRRLREAEKLWPGVVEIPLVGGWQHLLLDRPDEAIHSFERALAREPRGEIYAVLGQAYFLTGDRLAAREHLENAIRLDPALAAELQALLP